MAASKMNNSSSSSLQVSITGVPEVITEERSQTTQSIIWSYDSRDSISTADTSQQKHNNIDTQATTRSECEEPETAQNSGSVSSNTTQQETATIKTMDDKHICRRQTDNVVVCEVNARPEASTPFVIGDLEGKSQLTSFAAADPDNKSITEREISLVVRNTSPTMETDSLSKLHIYQGQKEVKTVNYNSSYEPLKDQATDPALKNNICSSTENLDTLNIKNIVLTDSQVSDQVVQEVSHHKVETSTAIHGLLMKVSDNPLDMEKGHRSFNTTQETVTTVPDLSNTTRRNSMQQLSATSASPLGSCLPPPKPSTKINVTLNNNNTPQPFSQQSSQNVLYTSTSQNDVTAQANQMKFPPQHPPNKTKAIVQPIPKVAIVPGMKGAVVAKKKGQFSVLKDHVISPNHIITGNTVPSQQGPATIVGGLQPLPKTPVNEHTAAATNIKQPLPKDSVQPPFTRPTSPRSGAVTKNNSVTSGGSTEPQSNVNHAAQNAQINGNTGSSQNQGHGPAIALPSNPTSNATGVKASVPPGATKIGRFILSSAISQPPTAAVIPTTIPPRTSPKLPEAPQQLATNRSTSESSFSSQNIYQRGPSAQLQQGAPITSHTPAPPKSVSIGVTNTTSLQGQNSSILVHPQKSTKVQGQNTNPSISSTLPNTTNDRPPPSCISKGAGLSGAIPGGMGKMLHFLDQMKLEATEADKFIISIQKDLKFLRDRNKELEMKCCEGEKRFIEEKKSREIAEAKVKCLKKKLRETKPYPPMVPVDAKHEKDNAGDLVGGASKSEMNTSCFIDKQLLLRSGSTALSSMTTFTCNDEQASDKQSMHRSSKIENNIIESEAYSQIDVTVQLNGKVNVKEERNKKNSRKKIEDDIVTSCPTMIGKAASKHTPLKRRSSSEAHLGSNKLKHHSQESGEFFIALNDTKQIQENKTDTVTQQLRSTSSILRDFDPFQPTASKCIEHDNRIQNQLSTQDTNIFESRSVPMFQNLETGIRNHHPHSISTQSFQGISMDDSVNKVLHFN